jgi:hypothetical protein
MAESFLIPAAAYLEGVRGGSRPAPLDVHAWTGRSALSSATTTSRPHIATAGARRTRVSEMRLLAARIVRSLLNGASIDSVRTVLEPRNPRPYHPLSG